MRDNRYNNRGRECAGANPCGIAFTDSVCFTLSDPGSFTFANAHSGDSAQQYRD